MIAGFLASTLGKYVVLAVVGLLVAAGLYLWIYRSGEAAAAAAASAAALEAIRRAAVAKAQVRNTKEEIDRDPYNRDRQ